MNFKKINFAKFSSMKIGKTEDVYIVDDTNINLPDAYLIGSCNNILVGKNPPPLMMLGKRYDYIKIEDGVLKIGGATPSGKIVSFCKKNDIADFEFITHLPGTLGGIVKMNAGLREYEIFNNLISVNLFDKVKQKDEIDFGYRYTDINTPILEASFELNYGFDASRVDAFKMMRSNQPKQASAGSCFKNPKGDYAGRLIEAVGLKGKRVGDMAFSSQHANFLVNMGRGSFDDALCLIQEAQSRVFSEFGISLKCEIVILDRDYLMHL